VYGHFATPGTFAPDIEFERIGAEGAGGAGSWHGLEAMLGTFFDYAPAFDNLRIDPERFTDLGDGRVLVLSRHGAVGATSGLPYEKDIADLLTLRDGQIVRWRSYWRRQEALEAVGLSE
jgi:ketosteroid isomerase-like protein